MHPASEQVSMAICAPFGAILAIACLAFWGMMCFAELKRNGLDAWPNCVGLLIICTGFECVLLAALVWITIPESEQSSLLEQIQIGGGLSIACLFLTLIPWFVVCKAIDSIFDRPDGPETL